MSQNLIDEIKQQQKIKNHQKIIELCNKLCEQAPDNKDVLWWKGQAHKNLGQYEQAETCFMQLQKQFPQSHLGWEGMVNIAEHQHNWDKMTQYVHAFQEHFPNLWHVSWWLGLIAQKNDHIDEAERHFQKVFEQNPTKHRFLEELIKIANTQQNHQKIIALTTEFKKHFPKLWHGYWYAGHSYKRQSQFRKAFAEFEELIAQSPELHQGYEGKINILEYQHDWQAVLHEATLFKQRFPNLWHSYYWEANAHRHCANYAAAINGFNEMMQKFPDYHRGIQGLIDVANDQADWEMALEFSEIAINLFPTYMPFYQQKGQALIRLKKFNDAENYFFALQKQFPNEPMPFIELINVYHPLRQHSKIIATLEQALQLFPNNQNIVRHLINAYINNNEPSLAQKIYHQYLSNKENYDNKIILARINQLILGNHHYLNEIEDIYDNSPHNHIHITNHYANTLFSLSTLDDKSRSSELALKIWEFLQLKHPKHENWYINLINIYIRLGFHDKAQQMIEQLPKKSNITHLYLNTWLAHKKGDIQQERQYYKEILHKHFFTEMQLEKGETELKLVSSKNVQLDEKDIVLFAVAHNELLRLPDFLNHYRQLGVNTFIFVDNNSNDGSLAFLLQQDDCHVFTTEHSFNEAGSGISWINYLIHQYAHSNQWCIHADIDELLVYPHYETQSLHQLATYLDSQNAEAMSSFMLDMYPANLQQQLAFKTGDNMLQTAPYFYNHYYFYHQRECPYIHPVGGILNHFEVPVWLTKTGLFKMRPDFYFLASTHDSTPMKIADVSSAYLHFKMLGDFKEKSIAEKERKEHFAGGKAYSLYAQMYEKYIDENTDLSALDKSVKYENSQQLVDLGLIKTSTSWEEFVRQSQK